MDSMAHGPRRRLETCSLLLTVVPDQDEPDGRHVHTMKADPAQRVYTTIDVLLT
jgi:hypothetical protein